ncbi:beta-galactosidase-1-like protein 2 [Anthonomus grandis grandis]|uniref:beta-galactosidase-1-like protein 2 n=1 Tax=Anthonomus grandis grandis TaxID=2921223 RepID=UPI0021663F64|nr:beta-galactosidase-1-like protein 2 [Anthonomus grandis grandis]
MSKLLIFVTCLVVVFADDLPTNYEYYTSGGILTGLSADQPYFQLNGKNITIISGAFHYFRVHPMYWRDRLRKIRAAGLNTVETYVPWNLHEPYYGVYDFGSGGSDFEEFLDVAKFVKMAQEEDLFVLLRPGPYICSEWEFGGLPSWLLGIPNLKLRTNDVVYLKHVAQYFHALFTIIAPLQFTNGGPIIAFQVENEYGNTWNHDPDYLRSLVQIFRNNDINELLYTSDPLLDVGDQGALPGELLITANFNKNASGNLNKLNELQSNKSSMAMEYWSGWFDHITENHTDNLVPVERYKSVLEDILKYPASVNIYMFIGSTNWGFTNGAGDGTYGLNNSGLSPSVTSYDYDGPVTEQGQLTAKYNATVELISKYVTVKTRLPEVPETPEAVVYDDVKIQEQILLSEIIDSFPNKIKSPSVMPMEQLSINPNNSGQNFGYIVYRKTHLNLLPNALLKINGYVRDHVLVLLNGKLVNSMLTKLNDLDGFGYWRLLDSTITLTKEPLINATLDLIVENMSRNNFGLINQFQQFKGLIDDVYIDNNTVYNWEIIPLEFKKSWNKNLTGWHNVKDSSFGPALYRVSFNASSPLRDTYINVQDWNMGIAIINGFVLGRIFSVGPQQALYLPAGLLEEGVNEIIIFEHFMAPEYLKFSKEHIWGYGSNIQA